MNSSLFSFYEEFGETARAKNEALAARAAFVSGVMEQSYRLWLTLLTTEVSEAMRAAQDLSICKSPTEVADVQRAWFQASSARAITSLQGTIEIANFLIKNLQDTATAIPAKSAPPIQVAAAPALTPAVPPTPVIPVATPVVAASVVVEPPVVVEALPALVAPPVPVAVAAPVVVETVPPAPVAVAAPAAASRAPQGKPAKPATRTKSNGTPGRPAKH